MRSAIVVAGVVAFAIACGLSRLPAPPLVGHPTGALTQVPFPPPPARVEVVPPRPTDRAVWIDGEWIWQARRWAWRRGRWVVPPQGASFAPWTSVRNEAGVLFFAEGAWRDAAGRPVADPKPLALARTSTGPVSEPEGEEIALPTVPEELPSRDDDLPPNDAGRDEEP